MILISVIGKWLTLAGLLVGLDIVGTMDTSTLRSMYELPYILQFLNLNKDKFGFHPVDTEVSVISVRVDGLVGI